MDRLGIDTADIGLPGAGPRAYADVEALCREIEESGLKVSCFAAQIANWSRPIDSDFELDLEEMNRALPRMARLGTPFIRCMSYPNSKEKPLPEHDWRRDLIVTAIR